MNLVFGFVLAIVVGYLVWHATRINQARLAIRSRRLQIRGMWREIRTFALRGILVLIAFSTVMAIALKL